MYAIRVTTSEKISRLWANSNRPRASFGLSCRPFRLEESRHLHALTMAGRGCRCCACSLIMRFCKQSALKKYSFSSLYLIVLLCREENSEKGSAIQSTRCAENWGRLPTKVFTISLLLKTWFSIPYSGNFIWTAAEKYVEFQWKTKQGALRIVDLREQQDWIQILPELPCLSFMGKLWDIGV
jgi:hypothetical protein